MTDEIINVGETLDLSYFLTNDDDKVQNNTEVTFDSEIDDDVLYKEGLQWTPTEENVGNTYTFEVGDKELSIKVTDVPDSVVDNFEEILYEDAGKTLSDYYDDDTNEFARIQSNVIEGGYALAPDTSDRGHMLMFPDDAPNAFPGRGDWFGWIQRWHNNESPGGLAFSAVYGDGYQYLMHGAFEEIQIRGIDSIGSTSTLENTSVNLTDGEWYWCEGLFVDDSGDDEGDLEFAVFEIGNELSKGDELYRISTNDTDYIDGMGFGFYTHDEDPINDSTWDWVRVLDE